MRLADVNVLIAAHRPDHPHHELARQTVTAMANAPFAVSVLSVSGFVRVTTNRRAFQPPDSLEEAFAFVDALTTHEHARVVGPGLRHLELLANLCLRAHATGLLVADAQHAAIAIEHDCILVTFDRDFKVFEPAGLKWRLLG